mmetsp:Transcript_79951/g.205658  ORF Transcript_79951/g.205658 Transcript_79951/m.205658 type:complete len:223 (+) Transcript_79951:887-1555(+)
MGRPLAMLPLVTSRRWCSRSTSSRCSASAVPTSQIAAATSAANAACSSESGGRQDWITCGSTDTAASKTTEHGWRICSRRASSSMASSSSRGSMRGSCVMSQRAQTLRASGMQPQSAAKRGPCSSRKAEASGITWQRQRRSRTASCSDSAPTLTMLSGNSASCCCAPSTSTLRLPSGGRIEVLDVISTCMCGLSDNTWESHRRNEEAHFWRRPWQPSRMSNR